MRLIWSVVHDTVPNTYEGMLLEVRLDSAHPVAWLKVMQSDMCMNACVPSTPESFRPDKVIYSEQINVISTCYVWYRSHVQYVPALVPDFKLCRKQFLQHGILDSLLWYLLLWSLACKLNLALNQDICKWILSLTQDAQAINDQVWEVWDFESFWLLLTTTEETWEINQEDEENNMSLLSSTDDI